MKPSLQFCIVTLGVATASLAIRPGSVAPASSQRVPLRAVDTVRAAPYDLNYSYGPKLDTRRRASLAAAASATIVVTYVGFSPQAQAAFQAAVDIWANVISSPVQIRVNAVFENLGSSILGRAGPQLCAPGQASFPGLADTYYAAALADRLAGADVCATFPAPDIDASFNSAFPNWDFGTTGQKVPGTYNFMTVVLHELAHGLGFIGSMNVLGGFGFWGDSPGFPYVYDRFAVSGSGMPLLLFPTSSSELAALLVSDNVFFSGPNARAFNSGINPKLESRLNPFNPDSSFSHVDDLSYTGTPNGLMTYQIAQAEVFTDPGPIVKGILLDEGWGGVTSPPPCTYSITPTSVVVPLGGASGGVAVVAPYGCSWTAQSNAGFITVTGGASGAGRGTVNYTVGSTTTSRVGTVTIAGQTFTVSQLQTLTVTPTSLTFNAVGTGGPPLSVSPPQSITVGQTGGSPLTWTASANQPWVAIAPASGTGPSLVTISINTAVALPSPAALSATITFSSPGSAASPTIGVALNAFRESALPFGSVDTPVNGQNNVTGSIAVTGWALDDFGVSRVRIYRSPVSGESNLVFIGDAVFVKGARPDVANAFPTYPFNDRAGWGYLLLTNFLPNLGNGTFTLHAYAEDVDGHSTLIGSRTITCTNDTATTPFGAIDTPEQGATVSGTSYLNFGWVLTPPPAFIPYDASTISVLVDSVSIGSPSDGGPLSARSDIQLLFSGRNYQNINNHLAVKAIDTTKLADGLHTIAWLVSDNLGRAAGIGSRYFTVANGAASTASLAAADGSAAPPVASDPAAHQASTSTELQASGLSGATANVIDAEPRIIADADEVLALRASDEGVTVTHGQATDADIVFPASDGIRHVHTAQMERVVIDVSAGLQDGSTGYRGYTLDDSRLRELPVGSHLDPKTGTFTWLPGMAFGGAHDLVFVRTSGTESEQVRVRVTIDARPTAAGEPRLVIDRPTPNAEVGATFTIAGWAFDPSGPATGTGIDALHVWAYPADDGARGWGLGARRDPIWIGVALTGGLRPDVGRAFGRRFDFSGYAIEATGLAPGTYDIVVYGHSIAVGRFTIARTVRVTVR